MLLLVGERLEAVEGVVQRVVAELVTQFFELLAEGVTARMLAHDERSLRHADIFRAHDLVGLRMLEHAVLMDAALMRERIPADDGLIVLHRKRRHRGYQLGGASQHGCVDVVPVRINVRAGAQRHHHFLERGVAGALADAVDRAFDLPCAAFDT